MLHFMTLFCLLVCFAPQTAGASCSEIVFLILRSSAVKEDVYKPFLEHKCVREGAIVFGNIDYNPLTADQPRDLIKMQELVDGLARDGNSKIVILAYSETGKFAAKLAAENESITAMFLMNPVDGTPPFSSPRRLPIFLDENFPILSISTTILESEFGPKFKRLGHSCVPDGMGPVRFYRHVAESALTKIYMDGLGHADFLRRSGINLVELMCGGGKLDRDTSFARVLSEWHEFLLRISHPN